MLEPGTIYTGTGDTKWVILPNGNAISLNSNGTYGGIPPKQWDGCKPKKVIGRLPPDQLDAKEWKECYKLPQAYLDDPAFFDVRWEGTKWVFASRTMYGEDPRHKPSRTPLTPGMVVAFRSWPARHADIRRPYWEVDVGVPLVVCVVGEKKRYIKALCECRETYLSAVWVEETDDIEVLGRVPLDQLYTATEYEPINACVEVTRGDKIYTEEPWAYVSEVDMENKTVSFKAEADARHICKVNGWDIVQKSGDYRWSARKNGMEDNSNDILSLINRLQPPHEEILRYQDELAEVKKERDKTRDTRNEWKNLFDNVCEDVKKCYGVDWYNMEPQKKGIGFMKKTIILVAAGALFSHLPLNDMYVSSVDYFKGSREVVHGDYQKTKVCGECETLMEHENSVICPKCGSENIEKRVAAPLYRNRGWPLSDIVVGTQFRNEDGSTRLVLEED